MRSHSHQAQREFYFDERDFREHLERKVHQAIHGENSVLRKLYSTGFNTERQKFNEEIQNTLYLSHKESWNLRDNNY